jgi:hypothetical protein
MGIVNAQSFQCKKMQHHSYPPFVQYLPAADANANDFGGSSYTTGRLQDPIEAYNILASIGYRINRRICFRPSVMGSCCSVLPNGFQVQVRPSLASAYTPSLSLS